MKIGSLLLTGRFAQALTLAICLALLVGCSSEMPGFSTKREPDSKNLPLYTNAEDIQIQNSSSTVDGAHVISYQASAAPQDVAAFYRAALAKDGWIEESVKSPSHTLYFTWRDGPKRPLYRLDVIISATRSGTTQVELKFFIYRAN